MTPRTRRATHLETELARHAAEHSAQRERLLAADAAAADSALEVRVTRRVARGGAVLHSVSTRPLSAVGGASTRQAAVTRRRWRSTAIFVPREMTRAGHARDVIVPQAEQWLRVALGGGYSSL